MTTRTWLFIGGGVLLILILSLFYYIGSKNKKEVLQKKIDKVNEKIQTLEYKKYVTTISKSFEDEFGTTLEEEGGLEGLDKKLSELQAKKTKLNQRLAKIEVNNN